MKLKRSTLGIILALSPALFLSGANANSIPWWEEFSNNTEFTESLPYIGYDLNELRENTAKGLEDSTDSGSPLHWLKRTMKMYPLSDPNSYNMPVAHHETQDWTNGLYGTLGRGIFYFTRTLGDKGQTIYIAADKIPQGVTCYAATGKEFSSRDKEYLNQIALKSEAETAYTFQEKGILTLGCGDPQKQRNDTFVNLKVRGGNNSHLYILGQSAQTDWAESKKVAESTGWAFLFDGRANVVVPNRIAQVAKDNINKVLGDTLQTVSLYEKINGMDGSEEMFTSSQGSMLWNYDDCCYARYRNGVANIHFYNDSIQGPGISWGIWHELGHLYEPFREYLTLFSEVQVNRYSLEACRLFKGKEASPAQCHENLADYPDWDKDSVVKFLSSGVSYDNYDNVGHFEGLKFFAFLRFSYGDNFFPKVNHARLKAVYAAPGITMADKYMAVMGNKQNLIDFSVFAYSQAAKQDLRQYFSRWGLHFSEAASKKVAALNLPEPGYTNGDTDEPEASVPADVTVQASISGSGVYELDGSNSLNAVKYTWKSLTPGFYLQRAHMGHWEKVIEDMPKVRALFPENKTGVAEYELIVENANGKQDSKKVKITVEKNNKNQDVEFISGLRALNLGTHDNGNNVTFSGSVTSSVSAASSPTYQWLLPSVAQGGQKDGPEQSFTISKTSQAQSLKVKVLVTAGKSSRTLEQTIEVRAKDKEDDNGIPAYDTRKVYNEKCTSVQHNGKVWQNQWYLNAGQEEPGKGNTWGGWREKGASNNTCN